jgi:hypothetical protein
MLTHRSSIPLSYSVLILAAAVFAALPTSARAWESEGHRMINRLAASTLPDDVPAFLRTPAAINEIEYLGPEPDRWRSRAEPELSAAQAPEHFIDLELTDALGPLPHKRLDFEAKVFAAGQRPEKIGLQPWETDEVWERLKAAMRQVSHPARCRAGHCAGGGRNHFLCGLAGPLRWRCLAATPRHRAI